MTRALLIALLALAALPVTASGAIPDLGTPPHKECGGLFGPAGSGCVASEPLAMDDTQVGDVTFSPHVVRVGQQMTMSVAWSDGWRPTSFSPPGTPVTPCPPPPSSANAWSCTMTMTSATNAYVRRQVNFCCFNAREQDYYAVIGEGRIIRGTVRNAHPLFPGQTVAAYPAEVTGRVGGKVFRANTSKAGTYDLLTDDGDGTVRTTARHCVKSALPAQCRTTETVGSGDTTIDWEAPPKHKISGRVVVADSDPPKPLKGVEIIAEDGNGGSRLAGATTDADGRYSMTVRAGSVKLRSTEGQMCAQSARRAEQCNISVTFDLQAARTQDWKKGGFHDIEVRLEDLQGAPIEGVTFKLAGPQTGEQVTSVEGRATFEDLEAGTYRVSPHEAPGTKAKPGPFCTVVEEQLGPDGAQRRPPACDVELDNQDADVEFQMKCGLDPENLPKGLPLSQTGGEPPAGSAYPIVTFGALEAVGCFEREKGTDLYKTKNPFRMNGVDVVPQFGAEVFLDKASKRVYTSTTSVATLWVGAIPIFIGPLGFDFGAPVEVTLAQAVTDKTPPWDIGGLPISPTIGFSSNRGGTTLSVAVAVPFLGYWTTGSRRQRPAVTSSVAIRATNADGSKLETLRVGIEGDSGQPAFFLGPSERAPGITKLIFERNFIQNTWAGEGEMKFGTGGRFAGMKLGVTGRFASLPPAFRPGHHYTLLDLPRYVLADLVQVTVKLSNANVGPFGPQFYFQDAGFDIGFDPSNPQSGFFLEGNAAISWLPRLDFGNMVIPDGKGGTNKVPLGDGGLAGLLSSTGTGFRGTAQNAFARGVGALANMTGIDRTKRIVELSGAIRMTWPVNDYPIFELKGSGLILKDHPFLQQSLGNVLLKIQGDRGELGADVGFTLPAGVGRIRGRVNGFLEAEPPGFLLSGELDQELLGFRGRGQAAISLRGIAACMLVSIPHLGSRNVGATFEFATNKYTPIESQCDVERFNAPAAARSAATGRSVARVRVGAGEEMAIFRVRGSRRAPRVVVTGPGGTTVRARSTGRQRDGVVFSDGANRTTYVIVGRPRAGRWTVRSIGGDAIRDVSVAGQARASQPRGRLTGTGRCTGRLAVTAGRAPVSVYETSAGSRDLLDTVTRSRSVALRRPLAPGVHTLTAASSPAGVPGAERPLASFVVAPSGTVVAAPGAPRMTRRGRTTHVRWGSSCGAERYVVRAGSTSVGARGTSVTLPGRPKTVTVLAVARDGTRSPAVKTTR